MRDANRDSGTRVPATGYLEGATGPPWAPRFSAGKHLTSGLSAGRWGFILGDNGNAVTQAILSVPFTVPD